MRHSPSSKVLHPIPTEYNPGVIGINPDQLHSDLHEALNPSGSERDWTNIPLHRGGGDSRGLENHVFQPKEQPTNFDIDVVAKGHEDERDGVLEAPVDEPARKVKIRKGKAHQPHKKNHAHEKAELESEAEPESLEHNKEEQPDVSEAVDEAEELPPPKYNISAFSKLLEIGRTKDRKILDTIFVIANGLKGIEDRDQAEASVRRLVTSGHITEDEFSQVVEKLNAPPSFQDSINEFASEGNEAKTKDQNQSSDFDSPFLSEKDLSRNTVGASDPENLTEGVSEEEIPVPPALEAYVETLIKSKKKLGSFKEFYFDTKKTLRRWKELVQEYHHHGYFSDAEYAKATELLGESEVGDMIDTGAGAFFAKKITPRDAPEVLPPEPEVAKTPQDTEPLPVIDAEPKTPDVAPATSDALIPEVLPPEAKEQPKTLKIKEGLPVIDVSPVTPDATPPIPDAIPVTPEAIPRDIDAELQTARDEYRNKYVEWKNNHREKKSRFGRLLADLGIDRQLPHAEEPAELVEARENWAKIRTEKAKQDGLFNEDKLESRSKEIHGSILNLHTYDYKVNLAVAKYTEEQYEVLYREIQDSLPELEKGIAGKVMEKWRSMSRVQRFTVSTVLLTAGGMFGGLGIVGAATYGGLRTAKGMAKGLVGAMAGQAVGKGIDGIFKKGNEKTKEERLEEYGYLVNEAESKREHTFARKIELEKNTKKKQSLIKALGMTATAVGTNVGLSSLDSLVGSPGHEVFSKKLGVGGSSSNVPVEAEDAPSIKFEKVDIKPVELSSKGFIADIGNLKAQILEQYEGKEIPASLKTNFLDKSNMELAKEFHFYDAETGASGLGLKGETLGLDAEGNVVLNRLDGSKDIIMNTVNGKVDGFDGKMFIKDAGGIPEGASEVANGSVESAVGGDELADTTSGMETATETTQNFAPEVASEADVGLSGESENISTNEGGVDAQDVNNKLEFEKNAPFIYNGVEIAHEKNGLLVLDDKFQEGAQYKDARSAYTQMFEESTNFPKLGTTPIAIPFEGGKIYIIAGTEDGPRGVRVLLNGKDIAKGFIGEKGATVKLLDTPGIKGGWFLADTVYEKAFKLKEVRATLDSLRIKQ